MVALRGRRMNKLASDLPRLVREDLFRFPAPVVQAELFTLRGKPFKGIHPLRLHGLILDTDEGGT
jgi:hypothetical protein